VTSPLIDGVLDVHVHSAPSIVARHTADPDTRVAADESGITGFVLKAHEGSTAERAALLGEGVFGGVVLNSPVGGANPDAVLVAARLGGRVVWLPTISSPAHRAAHEQPELQAHAGVHFREVPVCERPVVRAEWFEVLDEIAVHDLVLASGHLTMDETVTVFAEARRRGVRRLLVNHPMFPFLGWRPEHAEQLLALDARLEVGALADLLSADQREGGTATEQLVACYPAELLVFGSDLGHADYPTLGEGVDAWTRRMFGVLGEAALASIMTKTGRELIVP
jgi:Family of unknown function (DUF6282)